MDTVIAVFSDKHRGSIVGLCPPDGWDLVEGGHYTPNGVQELIYNHYVECCEKIREARKKCRLIVIENGDSTEGIHHAAEMVITNRVDDHQRMAIQMDMEQRKLLGYNPKIDQTYYVGGTPAHVANGAASEEIVARELKSVPRQGGKRFVHWGLKLNVCGKQFRFTHKGPTLGARKWLHGNVMRLFLQDVYMTTTEKKIKNPDLAYPFAYVFSHRHQFISPVHYVGGLASIWGFTTPSFQGPTDYSSTLIKADWASTIGMLIIKITDDGNMSWDCPRIEIEDSGEISI